MEKFCWYSLNNFPSDIFLNNKKYIEYFTKTERSWIYTIKTDILNPAVHNWFFSNGLIAAEAIVFFRKEKDDSYIAHIDTDVDCDKNITFCPSGINIELIGNGVMEFYDGDISQGIHMVTSSNQPFFYIKNVDNLNLIDENNFSTGPCLVRTDVVHRVRCLSAPRLLISIRFLDLDRKRLSWLDTVEILKSNQKIYR